MLEWQIMHENVRVAGVIADPFTSHQGEWLIQMRVFV